MLKGKLLHPENLAGPRECRSRRQDPHFRWQLSSQHRRAGNRQKSLPQPDARHSVGPQVLEALVSAIPIEAAEVMVPESPPRPPIFAEFEKLLPKEVKLTRTQAV